MTHCLVQTRRRNGQKWEREVHLAARRITWIEWWIIVLCRRRGGTGRSGKGRFILLLDELLRLNGGTLSCEDDEKKREEVGTRGSSS